LTDSIIESTKKLGDAISQKGAEIGTKFEQSGIKEKVAQTSSGFLRSSIELGSVAIAKTSDTIKQINV
jgi:hypothetical protein